MTGRSQFPRQAQSVPEGTQLNNMFEIDALVTAGGMGEVYRGHNIQTHDPVAIKIVLPEFAQDELILELFRKEARILNHLHHEAIVRYYVFSIDATLGLPFLVMEFVDGPSLVERIKAGPLDGASISTLQRHLADGLEKAHRAGVIHRDIAPDNIILPGGRVDLAKIIDFGIARSAIAGGGTLLGGQFAGKYNYVSPEQLGLFDGEVSNRSDIYSLGLVLAACARGRPLDMSGSQVEVIEKRRVVPDLSDIDPPLRGLLEAMLQPDPKDRPQSMAEVAAWPTFEGPAPDDEKTRIYTTPPSRGAPRQPSQPPTGQPSQPPAGQPSQPPAGQPSQPPAGQPSQPPADQPSQPPTGQPSQPPADQPSQPPADQPSQPPAAPVQHDPPPPTGPPSAPPAADARDDQTVSVPPEPVQKARPAERRPARKKSRVGLIAGGMALAAFLLAVVGGWLYVEHWSGPWYEDQPLVSDDPGPPPVVEEEGVAADPEPPEPEEEDIAADSGPAEPEEEIVADPEPPEPTFTAADIRAHVTDHDGGSCYFAFPADVSDSHAEVVGYGNQRDPFDDLRASFQARFGFDPAIDVRTVTDDQCVVVDALSRLTTAGATRVSIEMSRSVVRSGRSLGGTITGLGDRHLALVMLDNFGFVHNLAGYVSRDGGTATFEIEEMSTASPMDVQPQLVLSIASAEPLEALDLTRSLPASELLPALLEEAAEEPDGLATAVGYFMFGS